MTAREWLYRAWNLKTEIDQLNAEKKSALSDWKLTSSTDNVVVSGTKDPHKAMDAIMILTEQMDVFIARKQIVLLEMQTAVESMQDERARRLFRLRYVECKPWKVVYEQMNYSIPQCKRIEKRGMKEMELYLSKKMILS